MAVVIKRADQKWSQLIPRLPNPWHGGHIHIKHKVRNLVTPTLQEHMYSYMDDVNPVIMRNNTTTKEHNRLSQKVDTMLEREAQRSGKKWDRAKQSLLRIGKTNAKLMRQLGVTWDKDMNFNTFIRQRTKKAKRAAGALLGLCKMEGGFNSSKARRIWLSLVMPIFTYALELWVENVEIGLLKKMERVEYRFLWKIRGGYSGSSWEKLRKICDMPSLLEQLKDNLHRWTARHIQTPLPETRDKVKEIVRGLITTNHKI